MPSIPSNLTRQQIKALVCNAKAAADAGDSAAAMRVLRPLLEDVAAVVETEQVHPLSESDTWFNYAPQMVDAMASATRAWKADGFAGELPGKRAILEVAAQLIDGTTIYMDTGVLYRGVAPRRFLRSVAGQVFGADEHAAHCVLNDVELVIRARMLEEALTYPVPGHTYTGLAYVPGWDGVSLDTALDTLSLTIQSRQVMPSCAVRCDEAFLNLLRWAGVTTQQFLEAARETHGAQADGLAAELGAVMSIDAQTPCRVSAKDLVSIIDNGMCSNPLPFVYADVQLRALLDLDPRFPFSLSLANGKGFAAGLVDFVNGAGYLDTWPGQFEVPALATGFISDARYRYCVAKTFDIVRSYHRCVPAQQQLAHAA